MGTPEDIRVEGTSGWGWVRDARVGDTLGGWGTAGAGGVLETWGHLGGPPELGTPRGLGDRGVGVPRVGGNFMTWGPQGWGHLGGLGDSRAGGVLETWGHPELGTPQGHGDRGVGVPRVGDLGTPGLGTPEDIRVEGTSGWGWVRDARVGDTLGVWGTAGAGGILETWGHLGGPLEMGTPRGLGDSGVGVPRVGGNFMTWGPQGWGHLGGLGDSRGWGRPGDLETPWGPPEWGHLRDLGAAGLGTPGLGTTS